MTRLQRAFGKWQPMRESLYQIFEEQGLSLKGVKRTLHSTISETYSSLPEPQIKYILYAAIAAPDTTPEEKAQARAMLRLAETTTTPEQRAMIYLLLDL